ISNSPDIDPEKNYRKKIFKSLQHYNNWSVVKEWGWREKVWLYLFIYLPPLYLKIKNYYENRA
ncbi:hypothetical protein, partial [Bacillus subtilis]|uniref:hypothetical protein n=1 Tax=Bacillus subtilis TaxID=1423 RepID=UPI003C1F393A